MGNFEKPLTWVLAIVLLGYLFIANCDCGDGTACPLNSAFNIESSAKNAAVLEADETGEVTVEVVVEDEDTTVIVEANIDSAEVVIDDVEEDGGE